MSTTPFARRRFIAAGSSILLSALTSTAAASRDERDARAAPEPFTVYTFGDSILDCARYNEHGVHPGELLVRNDDRLFPDFKGQDLQSHGPARLVHRAVDGATVDGLPSQARGLAPPGRRAVALLTVGGNDLLRGLAADTGAGVRAFEAALARFVAGLPIRPVLLGNVYDPTLGDDRRNFLGVDASIARANHRRVNDVIAAVAARHGQLVDLHGHFLKGDPSWFTRTIEPSLRGASEVRRAFWAALQSRTGPGSAA
ncbi:SGNH/GDSL hydrolase family protein [Caldimonas brevitalea]|uniref:GDSL-like lipase/acylhydrolase n=1 Tax=Caldimonas brevitalea TaxID=413882 RepID=A0A0G3BWS8_9BURK|nr:SGNH/GDSL hydrolase family protein [Caldimonas brevitalea]AKJ31816.1 GDSL-like lipase/acylhydrolase [Caldimonas brevitalea]